jgi:hypothetical protein
MNPLSFSGALGIRKNSANKITKKTKAPKEQPQQQKLPQAEAAASSQISRMCDSNYAPFHKINGPAPPITRDFLINSNLSIKTIKEIGELRAKAMTSLYRGHHKKAALDNQRALELYRAGDIKKEQSPDSFVATKV